MDHEMDMNDINAINEDKKKATNNNNDSTIITDDLTTIKTNNFTNNSKVKLVSSDGKTFTLDYECVIQSGTIKDLLESNPNWLENKTGILEFPCIDSKILAKVVEYMVYKRTRVDEMVEEFFIEPEIALDMMLAADYLDL